VGVLSYSFESFLWVGVLSYSQLLPDYLTLVDTTGRIQRQGKRGFISDTFLPILQRLDIDTDEWIENTQNFEY
jgi:hypothetical protein